MPITWRMLEFVFEPFQHKDQVNRRPQTVVEVQSEMQLIAKGPHYRARCKTDQN